MDFPVDTPAVLVDLDVAERNIARHQAQCAARGLDNRPHIKTHKLPLLALRQIQAGAVGITCQKVSEAEAMVDGLVGLLDQPLDLLITYNILGAAKLARLRALDGRCRLSVVADSLAVIDGLGAAFADSTTPLGVLVECDTGAGRCGVASPAAALALAQSIHASAGLRFRGLMTYPPTGGAEAADRFLAEAKALIEEAGLGVEILSSGGSPDMMAAGAGGVVTEYRAGTYIYMDRSLVARGVAGWGDCALRVIATVVSVPSENRAIIDAGSKVLTSDLFGLSGFGAVLGRPDLAIDQLSEEHGRLVCQGPIGLRVGDRLAIVPNHACVVTNMMDAIHLTRGGRYLGQTAVVARGRVL
ncbi:alanine racemase [Rhodospirillum rubrum]|uniref:Alanine racemase-like n=1 Tax=Rhodospirillum rubrum (strain ATCC 11170 / ATH 1.1.1 / DSM 467 / LMG 4362 / NCIMB 8255 / S1) TaxID=269796 RepID=Q2RX77_RHORT|nr:alanine racemase [Rhodospirillum rubrum]ABC21268.1 Alanine racemase-like [Rhodospirillum rubrum ATCC 11170]AEO46946.1 alanine racemase-like protein [Rhodospirillum rubrum F11]MBK5952822.1 alanine racemase [Rhodospirillum rubrum]QXG80953.1 alanine racemase [Rhodospirillum rubrum]HAQ01223.1 alanine racemase [Rhodospirillum rubrum]